MTEKQVAIVGETETRLGVMGRARVENLEPKEVLPPDSSREEWKPGERSRSTVMFPLGMMPDGEGGPLV